jgi:hypothetical protein
MRATFQAHLIPLDLIALIIKVVNFSKSIFRVTYHSCMMNNFWEKVKLGVGFVIWAKIAFAWHLSLWIHNTTCHQNPFRSFGGGTRRPLRIRLADTSDQTTHKHVLQQKTLSVVYPILNVTFKLLVAFWRRQKPSNLWRYQEVTVMGILQSQRF